MANIYTYSPKIPNLRRDTHASYALGLLAVMHFAGFLGLQANWTRPWFEALVPFNLLATTSILLYFHQDWSRRFWLFALITSLSGFFVEVLGVHSQVIFGSYFYEQTLGYKILDVPVVIGLNWLMLIYITGDICHRLPWHWVFKSLLAAALMVLLDSVIEPVAIVHDFWEWQGGTIPLQNYLAWYIISFLLLCLFYLLKFKKDNPLSLGLYLVQILFFVAHCLSYV